MTVTSVGVSIPHIKLLVSDVDGTLVQPDKSLAPSTVAAAHRLREAGIQLAIVSARPPRGVRFLADELGGAAIAGFNGGMVLGEDGAVLDQRLLPRDAATEALGLLADERVSAWVFAGNEWLLTDEAGPKIELERRTVRFHERVVPSFEPYLDQVGKIVGVSDDHPHLAAVEHRMQRLLSGRASAHRSQEYYLDITHPEADKGHAVVMLAKHLGVPLERTAAIGDMPNDLPMFEVAGFAVAMGNGRAEVKARAGLVVGANDAGGWAEAADALIAGRAGAAAA